jgi:hypothetical protein
MMKQEENTTPSQLHRGRTAHHHVARILHREQIGHGHERLDADTPEPHCAQHATQ